MKFSIKYIFSLSVLVLILIALFIITLRTINTSSLKIVIKQPWTLDADGNWNIRVAVNHPDQNIMISASPGEVIPIAFWVFNAKALSISLMNPLSVIVIAKTLTLRSQTTMLKLDSPEKYYSGLQLSAKVIGPYLINLGWAWLDKSHKIEKYQLLRSDNEKKQFQPIAILNGYAKNFHDQTVQPQRQYQYQLIATTDSGSSIIKRQKITTPPAILSQTISAMRGKGITVFFTSGRTEKSYFKKLNPHTIVEEADRMGIRYIQLRTIYGSYSHVLHPDMYRWLDELLDESHQHHIVLFSWCIPQRESSRALAEDILLASHKSAQGNSFAGISLDLEIGKGFITDVTTAKQQIADYVKWIRAAVGPHYLLSAIVFSPWRSGYTDQNFPYREIAQYADILQPMEFWHHYFQDRNHVYTQAEVASAITNSISLTQKYAGRKIPINLIGQITDLGETGIPSAQEITTALQTAKDNNAIGLTFFNWHDQLFPDNQYSEQAIALKKFNW